ncbi:MAG TPA: sigma-70 family RNA polymerase sigma factor [Pyrinomonadaceae bacterium]|jgi:RNA polymerase sigma factor (TIGR02999 family)|nr:sigma-70 family RNA polymerase sigma factor [Pyrinomonadaceae bacterium]
MLSDAENVNRLLADWGDGNQQALEELLPLIYNELRRLAHNFLYSERTGHTLQTTALVHEAYLKLSDQKSARWQNRAHFFAIAAQAMRRILIDSARSHAAEKRGGAREKVSLDDAPEISSEPDKNLLALDEALNRLQEIDPQQGRIVELRYFGGLTIEETAEVTKLSPATIKREWTMARAWLHQKLSEDSDK